jgi:hypothetical protein
LQQELQLFTLLFQVAVAEVVAVQHDGQQTAQV